VGLQHNSCPICREAMPTDDADYNRQHSLPEVAAVLPEAVAAPTAPSETNEESSADRDGHSAPAETTSERSSGSSAE